MTLFNTQSAACVIAAQLADNDALALSVSVPDLQGGPPVAARAQKRRLK